MSKQPNYHEMIEAIVSIVCIAVAYYIIVIN